MWDSWSSQINSNEEHRRWSHWWFQGCGSRPCDLTAEQTDGIVSTRPWILLWGERSSPRSSRQLPEAEFCSKLLFLWSCPWGGGTAHWEQVKQRSNVILATFFFCLSNSPEYLINPHFVTTINSLLQVLGIQWEKTQFNVFGEEKPDLQKCQINWISQNSDFPSAYGIDVPDCLKSVLPHNENLGPFSESWQEGRSWWGVGLSSQVTSERTRGNSLSLCQRTFRLSIRENFSMERAVQPCHRAKMAFPSLEGFKSHVDVAPGDMG